MPQRRPALPIVGFFKAAAQPSRLVQRLRYAATEAPAPARPHLPLSSLTPRDDDFRNLSFTFALIALSAKVTMADGPLTREKYVAFRALFPLSGGLCLKLRKLFALACHNTTPFSHYTTQILQFFPAGHALHALLVERLFSIALAGGDISVRSEQLLAKIARALGISAADYVQLRERQLRPRPQDILGLRQGAPKAGVKQRYHSLMRQYHPDRFASEKISAELEMLLQLKVSEINAAYRSLSRRA